MGAVRRKNLKNAWRVWPPACRQRPQLPRPVIDHGDERASTSGRQNRCGRNNSFPGGAVDATLYDSRPHITPASKPKSNALLMIGVAVVLRHIGWRRNRDPPMAAIPSTRIRARAGEVPHPPRVPLPAKTKRTWLRSRAEHFKWAATMDHHRNNRNMPSPCKSF